jgi:hypothetical protein
MTKRHRGGDRNHPKTDRTKLRPINPRVRVRRAEESKKAGENYMLNTAQRKETQRRDELTHKLKDKKL